MKDGLPFSILLVDSDEDDRFIIDEAFLQIGYDAEVKKFINGSGLLHYLTQIQAHQYPSLIVLDNTYPDADAEATLLKLKSNPAFKDIPVAVYSDSLPAAKKEQLFKLGAYKFFEKANTMAEVIEIMKELKKLSTKQSKKV